MKYYFEHMIGELFVSKKLEKQCLKTIVCIADADQDYRYGIRIVAKSLCKNRYRVYCFCFDKKEHDISFGAEVGYVEKIVNQFKKQKYTKDVILLGIGVGATYTETVASRIQSKLSAMILFEPKFSEKLYDEQFYEECYQEEKADYKSKFNGPVLIVSRDGKKETDGPEDWLSYYENAELNVLDRGLYKLSYFAKKRAADLCCDFLNR